MGASESKLAFKEDIFRLAGDEKIPIDSQWWLRVSRAAKCARKNPENGRGVPSDPDISAKGLRHIPQDPSCRPSLTRLAVPSAPRNSRRCSDALVAQRSPKPHPQYSRRPTSPPLSNCAEEERRDPHIPHDRTFAQASNCQSL